MNVKRYALPLIALGLLVTASTGHASLIGVSGPLSTAGMAAKIIDAPSAVLEDLVTNAGMQGFNEAQGVVTSQNFSKDGGLIRSGTTVNSHMIFLNSDGPTQISHGGAKLSGLGVVWTFDAKIIGVMSDFLGTFEAASTSELGNPSTNYTITNFNTNTGPVTGLAAPFAARGFELNDWYTISADLYSITVGMNVTEPGDWMRVVTGASPVPEPTTMLLFGVGLAVLAGARLKRSRE